MSGTPFLIYIFGCNELYISFNPAENVILKITAKHYPNFQGLSQLGKITLCFFINYFEFFYLGQRKCNRK